MMWLLIMLLSFGSAGLLAYLIFPPASDKFAQIQEKRSEALADKMDQIFIRAKISKIALIYTLAPPALAVAGYLLFPPEIRLGGVAAGACLGFIGPGIYIKIITSKRWEKFNDQLVDSLMIMSSSLKGGLSIIQAIEVVTEEMPEPINQEFGVLLGENKMGISLEEAFAHLYERMPSNALYQLITAVLLARETGGNLPAIFSRIVATIRENKKIKQNLDNLTLQGRIQGAVMTLLPIAFAVIVTSTNKDFFQIMLTDELGRMLLIYAITSELIGAFLIWKISSFKEF
ncbi:MAG: type II secretion system F family protein [Candidatus Omnitrophota bacterium]